MNNLTDKARQEVERVRRAAARSIANAEAHYEIIKDILPHIPERYTPPFVHVCELYGSTASINFEPAFSESIRKGEDPDADLLTLLLDLVKPEPLALVKDGCTSFRPLCGTFRDGSTVEEVYPVRVRIDNLSGRFRVEWFGWFGERFLRMDVGFHPWRCDLGGLRIDYVKNPRTGDDNMNRIQSADFLPKHGAKRIRWSRTDDTQVNDFTVYWPTEPTIPLAEIFRGKEQPNA